MTNKQVVLCMLIVNEVEKESGSAFPAYESILLTAL